MLTLVGGTSTCLGATPVDLGGTFFFSGDGTQIQAVTVGSDRVSEPAGALEGTYSPFSDARKPPQLLALSLLGRSMEADIECLGAWAQDGDGIPDRAALGSLAGSAFVIVERTALGFRFRDPDGDLAFLTDTTGATRFRVRIVVDGAGSKTISVTTLDGSSPGTMATSNQNGGGPSGAVAGFKIALTGGFGRKGTGAVKVSNFTATAPGNSLSLFADDCYVRPGETIDYRLGMSNLMQPVGGFQAFLAKQGLLTAQTYVTGLYTNSPFPAARFWGDPIPASLYVGAGIAFGGSLVTSDARLANLYFTASSPGTVGLGILTNQGAFETVFTDDLGTPYYPARQDSNWVVVDGTPPMVDSVMVEQIGEDALEVGLAAGPATVSAHVSDASSGLAARPTIRIDYAPLGDGPEDEVVVTYSTPTANVFAADLTVPQGKLSGPGRIVVTAIDDAGNATISAHDFLVARRFTGTVDLQDYDGDASLWTATIEFRPAGTGIPVATRTVPLASDGTFLLNQVVADGTYDIRAKATHWLAQLRLNEIISGSELSGLDFSLRNADCNDDNAVDIADYAILSYSYGTSTGETNFDVMADLNGDESIDIADYAILSANYSASGDD